MQAVGTKNRSSLHSIDDSVLKTRESLSIGIGGHVRKGRRGSLSCGIFSPVWADIKDWSDDAFELSEIYQIFGHSQQESGPVIGEHFACLDCRKAFRLDDKGVILPYCE